MRWLASTCPPCKMGVQSDMAAAKHSEGVNGVDGVNDIYKKSYNYVK